MRRLARLRLATWAPVVLAFACGGSSSDPGTWNPDTQTGTNGSSGTGAAQNNNNGNANNGSPNGNNGNPNGAATAVTEKVTVVTPVPQSTSADQMCQERIDVSKTGLDVVIMMDKSMTMTEPSAADKTKMKWDDIKAAISAFATDPESADIGVGVGFFAIFVESPCKDGDCITCSPNDYANLAAHGAAIGELSSNATNVINAMDRVVLEGGNNGGQTPIYPALEGALQAADTNMTTNAGRKTVVVLATDGIPNVCNSSMSNVLRTAEDGVRRGIKTYLVGTVAAADAATLDGRTGMSELGNLSQMAQSGGTGAPFIVDLSGSSTTKQFISAMNSIRDANNVGCQFDIPPAPNGKVLDLSQATVTYLNGSGGSMPLGWVTDSTACAGGDGFYYDDNDTPTTVRLCTKTCDAVTADAGAKIDMAFACPTGTTTTGGGGDNQTGGGGDNGSGANGGHGGEPIANPECLMDFQVCTSTEECCSNASHAQGSIPCVCGPEIY